MLLSKRQLEVMQFVSQGYRNNEIAIFLGIQVHSVRAIISRAMRTISARNRYHAVAICVKNSWVTIDENVSHIKEVASFEKNRELHPAYNPSSNFMDRLTKREYETFLLLADVEYAEMTNRALANHLNISRYTLRNRLRNIYRKCYVSNRAALVLLAYDWKRGQS